jgi:trehalose-6-phosphatase
MVTRGRQVGALFTDYDGTIAPDGVPRAVSRVPESTLSKLVGLSSKIPVAVITSKDYGFIQPRTAMFASAWACVSGLDLRLADGRTFSQRPTLDIGLSLERAVARLPPGILVERKTASDGSGRLLGFSLDWTFRTAPSKPAVRSVARELEGDGLHVSLAPTRTYLDAFASRPSKGRAFTTLAKALGVKGDIVYLGDSEADNEAFQRCDIGIGVDHGQPTVALRCRYVVPASKVDALLASLAENPLDFHPAALATRVRRPSPSRARNG